MDKKCIIFCRVSTDRQNFDEQENRLVRLAIQRGYPPDRQIIIGYKESGIRLSEEERLGLNDLKEYIAEDASIDCVFAFEISRIARSKKVLFSIEEFLVSRKIQLVIEEPSITLLNADGSVNDAADFAFTMFAQMAESEMRIKQERFRNGRERAKKEGHWHGGCVLFGFRVEDKRYVPDEKTSHIVRRVFEMYAEGQSQEYIAKYLQEYGLKTKGYNVYKTLNNPKYVEIVGQELFDAVQAVKTAKTHVPKYRIYSPGEQLIKCPCCGRHYIHATNCYICLGRMKKYGDCAEGFSVASKYMDAFLIMSAKYTYAARMHAERDDSEKRYRQILDEIPGKIEQQNILIHKMENKKSRIIELYTESVIDKKEFERRMKEVERSMRKFDEASSELIRQQTAIRTALNNLMEGKSIADATLQSFTGATKREIYEIVHKEVKEVIPRTEGRYHVFDIIMNAGFTNTYRTSGQGISFRAEMLLDDGRWEDITDLSFLDDDVK